MLKSLREPINRRIIWLVVSFLLALGTIMIATEISRITTRNLDGVLANQQSRRSLAEVILHDLQHIELEVIHLSLAEEPGEIPVPELNIGHSITEIRGVLKVLQQGGEFEYTVPVNFPDVDEIKQSLQFYPPYARSGYVIEVLNLTPRMRELERLIRCLGEEVRANFESGGAVPRIGLDSQLMKQIGAMLQSSRESANKIYYTSSLEIERRTQKHRQTLRTVMIVRYALSALVALFGLVLSALIIRRISAIMQERRRARSSLQEALDNTERILEAMPFGVAIIRKNRKIISVNDAALRILKRTREELLGKRCHEVLCPTQRDKCPVWDLGEEVDSCEWILIGPNQEKIPCVKTALPIELDGEEVLLEAFVDISQQKEAQGALAESNRKLELSIEQAQQLTQEAEAANAAKSMFLANMSHEIRTPITAIVGYSDLMNRPGLSVAEQAEWSELISHNARQLMVLVNDILDLSKIEAGQLVLNREFCRLDGLLGEVDAMMCLRAEQKGLRFDCQVGTPVPLEIESDGPRLRQILLNLLSNAVKFTDTGSVTLTARGRDLPGGMYELCLEVIDSGIGIEPEQLEKMFQSFTQVHDNTLREYGGTGLGLDIARRLAEGLGGELTADSTPGRGSSFLLRLPLRELERRGTLAPGPVADATRPQSGQEPALPDFTGRRLLVVEDGVDNQRIIRYFLEETGAAVELVENGALGVEAVLAAAASGSPFDLVLMDMRMPVMDGYEATARLRKHGMTIPIIALTAHAMSDDRHKTMEAGCSDYLTKPIIQAEFYSALRKHLPSAPVSRPAAGTVEDVTPAVSSPPDATTTGRILSTKHDDAKFAPLLQQFLAGIPAMIAALRDAMAANDLEEVRTLTHRLKGSGSSYGFPVITEQARNCEQPLREGGGLEEIEEQFEELLTTLAAVSFTEAEIND